VVNSNLLNQQEEKWYNKLDLFKFLPVPKTRPLSSRRSIIGSILFLLIIFVYILSQFIFFLTSNTPKV